MFRTMELIRKYCFGDGDIKIQVVSDQSVNFPNFKTVNFADPNFNIATPIFVIHGNHDDPAGVRKKIPNACLTRARTASSQQ